MLRARLDALRRDAGARDVARLAVAVTAPDGDGTETGVSDAPDVRAPLPQGRLAQRLDRMTRARTSSRSRGLDELIRLTGAVARGDGLLTVETRITLPFRHGRVVIGAEFARDVCLPLRCGDHVRMPAGDLLFLDTETSGLAGGTGTFVFLLGLARFRAGAELVVQQFLVTRFGAETGMLGALRDALGETRCVVTFNGKSFDVPLLRTRCALLREPDPFTAHMHCDLLHATRRLLRDGWPDCRLRTTEIHALGFDRIDDLPGAEVPAAWHRWLTHADVGSVPRILEHNRDDLVSLAALTALLNSCEAGTPLFRLPA